MKTLALFLSFLFRMAGTGLSSVASSLSCHRGCFVCLQNLSVSYSKLVARSCTNFQAKSPSLHRQQSRNCKTMNMEYTLGAGLYIDGKCTLWGTSNRSIMCLFHPLSLANDKNSSSSRLLKTKRFMIKRLDVQNYRKKKKKKKT